MAEEEEENLDNDIDYYDPEYELDEEQSAPEDEGLTTFVNWIGPGTNTDIVH